MSDAVAEFVARLREIAADESTPLEDRWQKLGQAAVDAVNALRGDCRSLLNAVGFENPDIYRVVARAIDIYCEYPQVLKEDKKPGALGLMPVLLTHSSSSAALPRHLQIGERLPPMPDGNPVPALTDFLLAWEEVTDPLAITKIHEAFRREDAEQRICLLTKMLGGVGAPSHFDGLQQRDSLQRSLRFLPFYRYDGDTLTNLSVFDDPKQRSAWQERAIIGSRKDVPVVEFVQPIAPTTYPNALWAALRTQIVSTLELLFDGLQQERSSSVNACPPRLLIEPIGVQSVNIANRFRLSMLYEDALFTRGSLTASYFGTNWHSRWASWNTVTSVVEEIALQVFGSPSLTAQLVQEASLIFDQEGTGITIVLGPSVAFDPPEPDRLRIESANDQTHENAKWWKYEYESVDVDARAVRTLCAAAAEKGVDEVDVFPSFVIRNNGWRPAYQVYFGKEPGDKGAAVDLPLSEEGLRATASMLGVMLGRQWVFAKFAGSEGFTVP